MVNYVKPEWLPTVPADDGRGPFYCYVLWSKDSRAYYVGHTADDERRIKRHLEGRVRTTKGHDLIVLWVSRQMFRGRGEAKKFEAALKSYVKSGNSADFKRCTGLYLAKGAGLLESR